MSKYHLAQINIAYALGEMDSEIMEGFVSRLDEINAIADKSEGFVWRLQDEEGDSTSIRVFDDPMILVNMSVWEDVKYLKNFVYKSAHVEMIRDRDAWFKKMPTAHQALWWIPTGKIPTVDEGKEKLRLLEENGPTEMAFTFGKTFPSPSEL